MRAHYERYACCPSCGHRYGAADFDASDVVFRCGACCYAFYQNSRPSATAVIPRLGSEHEIVLITRNGGPCDGGLALPGGIARYDENPEACARRETFEETLISIEVTALLGIVLVDYEYQESRLSILEHAFLAAPIDLDLTQLHTAEAREVAYYDVWAKPRPDSRMAFQEQVQVLDSYRARLRGR